MILAIEPVQQAELDTAVASLAANKQAWARTSEEERIAILAEVKERLMTVAKAWAKTASRKKQIPEGSPLEGEEWLSGPYTVMTACNALMDTLSHMRGKAFLEGIPIHDVGDGQIAARVVPHSIWDHLLLSGFKADIWLQKGVSYGNLAEHVATAYDVPEAEREGSVSLVLGAGNIAAIAPLDCFQKLFTEHSVVLLKMNPVNDYLIEFLEPALEPLVAVGALRIAKGGVAEGEYLCNHPAIESIHITGAESSHDAIVWGVGEEGAANKRNGTPRNPRRITSELGAVCPTIVVPGPWTKADLEFQAEQVATQKLHNAGFNCVACQMLVTPSSWDKRDRFVDALRLTMTSVPARGLYYPGAADRIAAYTGNYPDAEMLDVSEQDNDRVVVQFPTGANKDYAQSNEVFAPVLGVTDIGGDDAETFLRNAIRYCNDELHGTLGANIIIHPKTRKLLGEKWNELLTDLHYGCIGVNAWTALGFLAVQAPWGAYPGHTLDDVQSGIGFVHNTYMFENVERTVIEAPFRPFPRNLLHGGITLLPRPPWFVTNKTAHKVGELLTRFQFKPSFLKIPRIFLNALLG